MSKSNSEIDESIDWTKIKTWFAERESKAKKKKWAWPVLIVYALFVAFLLFSKLSCTLGNEGNYQSDHVFFFEKFWFQCLSLEDFDKEYLNGSIALCLALNPGEEDPWKCNMNSQVPSPESSYEFMEGLQIETTNN